MSKIEDYRCILRELKDWRPFLLNNSGLPGPRGNLELAYAVAEEGDESKFLDLLSHDHPDVRENTPDVFLVFCGVVGLGKLLVQGKYYFLEQLKRYANDPRWRIRESVAIAMQIFGGSKPGKLIEGMKQWAQGSYLEQRAAVAALCEPALLKSEEVCRAVLMILDDIMFNISQPTDRKSESFRVLRQTLGYGWSVAVTALPEPGKDMFARWLQSDNKDVQWIMVENLKKNRLHKLDPRWVEVCQGLIAKIDHPK